MNGVETEIRGILESILGASEIGTPTRKWAEEQLGRLREYKGADENTLRRAFWSVLYDRSEYAKRYKLAEIRRLRSFDAVRDHVLEIACESYPEDIAQVERIAEDLWRLIRRR